MGDERWREVRWSRCKCGLDISDDAVRIKHWEKNESRCRPNVADTNEYFEKRNRVDRFPLQPFGKIALNTAPAYLVKGLIPRVGLVVVWGPPKCGKSFWTFDLSMHVALGWEYRRHKIVRGAVVYLVLEGDSGFRNRAEAWRQTFMAEEAADVPFYMLSVKVDLIADHAVLVQAITEQLPISRSNEGLPVAVVIDTVNRSFTGSESSDEDMTKYIRAADVIRSAFECAVILVHHCGIETSRPRGHTSLTGAADAQLAVRKSEGGTVSVTVEFNKDGPEGEVVTSRLRQVELGVDDDGDPITSLVVDPVEGPATKSQPKPVKLTKGAQIALRALNKAVAEVGTEPPASNHVPDKVKTVTIDQWRDYAYRIGISESDLPNSKFKAFGRACEALLAAQKAAVWHPYAWPV